jgi:hypothetical protein
LAGSKFEKAGLVRYAYRSIGELLQAKMPQEAHQYCGSGFDWMRDYSANPPQGALRRVVELSYLASVIAPQEFSKCESSAQARCGATPQSRLYLALRRMIAGAPYAQPIMHHAQVGVAITFLRS